MRARWIIERRLRGATLSEIAAELQMSPDTVKRELKRGENQGLVADVRDKLLATLDGAASVYADILNPANTPETLHKHSRGYKLKLDAANSLSDGLGVFKRESAKQVTNTLELVARETVPGPQVEPVERKRIAFNPDVVEGELLTPEQAAVEAAEREARLAEKRARLAAPQ